MPTRGLTELKRTVSRSVYEFYIDELVERLSRQSRFGRIPDGVSSEVLEAYRTIRYTLFDGQEDDEKGSKLAWRLLVKTALFLTDY